MILRRVDRVFGLVLGLMFVSALAACGGSGGTANPTSAPAPATATLPAPTDTLAPTAAATPSAPPATPNRPPATSPPTTAPTPGAQIAVQMADNSVQVVGAGGNKTLLFNPNSPVDLSSIFPPGNVLGTSLYLPITGVQPTVMRVDTSGGQKLDWIKGPVYGIAVTSSHLAWGTADLNGAQPTSQLMLNALDGSQLKAGIKETYTGIPRVPRVVRWSRVGATVYFGKEPLGIGGYILFSGLTNLWSYDLNSGKTTELVHERSKNAAVCIDDLSPDEKLVADHCSPKNMELIDLTSGKAVVVQAPANVPDFGIVGGARFSPDSSRLAYALARRDPENEQGWVAITEALNGTSKLIATSPAKDYFAVTGWLDADTIILQSEGQTPGIWTVGANGSNLKRVSDGTFLGIVAGGQPQQAACGEIRMQGPNPPKDSGARLAEDCFWQAFQDCRAASLTVTMAGVDAGTIHRFTLEKDGGRCKIVDSAVTYVIPRPTPAPVVSTCNGLIRQNGGLLFKGCGDQGDISVPAP